MIIEMASCRVDHRSVTKRDRLVKCQVTSQDLVYLRYAKVLFVMFCHIFIPLQLLGTISSHYNALWGIFKINMPLQALL